MKILVTSKQLFDIFSWGADYGQLTMEEEREQEEWADAFQGVIIDSKYNMPSHPAPRRQLHSEKWFNAKKESLKKFEKFLIENLREDINDQIIR
uniref:Uncharacterized protein n=1 Tax=Dulem virus 31 TaxID=3145749 RepID=A0AAU8AU90_9VIRU